MFACCLYVGLILSPGEELKDLEDSEDVESDEKKYCGEQVEEASVSLERGGINNSFHGEPREGSSSFGKKKERRDKYKKRI